MIRTTRRCHFLAVLVAAALLGLSASPAEAKFVEVYGKAGLGGMTSSGTNDFLRLNRGAVFGAEVGVKLFFIDAFFDYFQFFTGDGAIGYFSQVMLGSGWSPQLGPIRLGIRGAVGYGFGGFQAGNAFNPQESVDTRGLVLQANVDLYYTFFKVIGVGVTGIIGYHYLMQGGGTGGASSQGAHFIGLGGLRVGLGF